MHIITLTLLLLVPLASATFNLTYPPRRSLTYVPKGTERIRNVTAYPYSGLARPCGPSPPSTRRTPFSLRGGSPLEFVTYYDRSTVRVDIALVKNATGENLEDWIRAVPAFFLYGQGGFCWDPFVPVSSAWVKRVKNGTEATIMVVVTEGDSVMEEYSCADVVLVDEVEYEWALSCRNDTDVMASDWIFPVDEKTGKMVDRRKEVDEEWQKKFNASGKYGRNGLNEAGSGAGSFGGHWHVGNLMVSSLVVVGVAFWGLGI
ncbi:hypothetical protein BJ508DRAFT_417422 [Ascobolus immersus RN42]|uniref:Copper acquisition factor BIM1-like domain-containing protein n=1 Tax=Ascobolus immersus RN42 TaxID=1160509 RepID=A0A3N4I4R9_ASCIM|nr:hypothetical protein BJ508DRAFT_417422 [Ascobolus immersus RN42]